MSAPDENKLNERLERALPHLLSGQPYDWRQEIANFKEEEASLDEEIDRVWQQSQERQDKVVPFWQRNRWWSVAAAAVVAVFGLAGIAALTRIGIPGDGAPAFNTLRSDPHAFDKTLARALEQAWQPDPAARAEAQKHVVLNVRVTPRTDGRPVAAVDFVQSSGSAALDQSAFALVNRKSLYAPLTSKLPSKGRAFTVDFDPNGPNVRVREQL